jgi:hypothetical protein
MNCLPGLTLKLIAVSQVASITGVSLQHLAGICPFQHTPYTEEILYLNIYYRSMNPTFSYMRILL